MATIKQTMTNLWSSTKTIANAITAKAKELGMNILDWYSALLLMQVTLDGEVQKGATWFWRLIIASPVLTVVIWLLYWLCIGWSWFVDVVNYVYWGIPPMNF